MTLACGIFRHAFANGDRQEMNGKHHPHFAKRKTSRRRVDLVVVGTAKVARPGVMTSGHRAAQGLLGVTTKRKIAPRVSINGQERHVSPASDAGVTPYPVNGNGGHMHTVKVSNVVFRPFGDYDNGELRAVKFRNDKAADLALVKIGESSQLRKMPFLFADGLTFIIPQEAIDLLKALKLRFSISRVLEMAELNPDNRAEIRRNQCL